MNMVLSFDINELANTLQVQIK